MAADWRGLELFARDDWEVHLSPDEIAELGAGRVPERTRERMAKIQADLEHGSGAVRVRGLPVGELSEPELASLFEGLATLVGTPVSQGADGARLLHVRDEGFGPGDPRFRGPHSNRRLSFHTDRCDVIAFLCVRQAVRGGENDVLCSRVLRDALRAKDAAAARVLEEPLPYLRHTVDGGNERPFTMVPVFSEHGGHFAASFLRVLVDRADRDSQAPDVTDEQRRAMDVLEDVAEDPSIYARFRLEPGDLLLLNNWVTFHRRTEFEDHAEPALRRHLMRIWLSVPNSRALDPRFADHFGATAAGALRGGMRSAGAG